MDRFAHIFCCITLWSFYGYRYWWNLHNAVKTWACEWSSRSPDMVLDVAESELHRCQFDWWLHSLILESKIWVPRLCLCKFWWCCFSLENEPKTWGSKYQGRKRSRYCGRLRCWNSINILGESQTWLLHHQGELKDKSCIQILSVLGPLWNCPIFLWHGLLPIYGCLQTLSNAVRIPHYHGHSCSLTWCHNLLEFPDVIRNATFIDRLHPYLFLFILHWSFPNLERES